jgi:hypothetical protein
MEWIRDPFVYITYCFSKIFRKLGLQINQMIFYTLTNHNIICSTLFSATKPSKRENVSKIFPSSFLYFPLLKTELLLAGCKHEPQRSLLRDSDNYSKIGMTDFFFPLALQPTFGPWPTSMKLSVSLHFSRSWTFGRTPWTGDQPVARPLPVHKHRKTHIHKH